MDENGHIAKIYLCMTCGKTFLSKNGAKFHLCLRLLSSNASYLLAKKHKTTMQYIIRYIAITNTPFRSADNQFLRLAMNTLDNTFVLPGKDKLRQEMLNLSDQIKRKMKKEISGQFISLLFDSCHRWGNDYQGIIIHTYERLYLWSIERTENSKAKTFSELLTNILEEIES